MSSNILNTESTVTEKVTITVAGVTYTRNYQQRFCQLPECGRRIQFRMSAKGVPESNDKYNKRIGCCSQHSKELRKLRLEKEDTRTQAQKIVDAWFSKPLIGDNQ